MKIAIVKDSGCLHPEMGWCPDWVELCEENHIQYKVFDSQLESFIKDVVEYIDFYDKQKTSEFLLWRSGQQPQALFKDTLQRQILEFHYGINVVPNWNVHKLYESKIFQSYLFKSQGYPHPETRIFFDKNNALQAIEEVKYPFIVKSSAGAGSASFRFIENKEQARYQIEENFGIGLQYHGSGRREKGVFYMQEYIQAPGIYRIVMIGDDIGYSFYQTNKPGTKIASSQGYDSYPPTPIELLDISSKINREMNWQYMMYDYIYSEEKKKWLILELTDTCGRGHSAKRKITHCLIGHKWKNIESNISPQEIIFRKYILGKGLI